VQPSTVVTFRVVWGAGHCALGGHVEEHWLPVLGPTCYLLARRVILHGGDGGDIGFTYRELADALGVAPSKARDAIHRLIRFGPVSTEDEGHVIVVPNGWPEAPQRHHRPAPG